MFRKTSLATRKGTAAMTNKTPLLDKSLKTPAFRNYVLWWFFFNLLPTGVSFLLFPGFFILKIPPGYGGGGDRYYFAPIILFWMGQFAVFLLQGVWFFIELIRQKTEALAAMIVGLAACWLLLYTVAAIIPQPYVSGAIPIPPTPGPTPTRAAAAAVTLTFAPAAVNRT